MNILVVGSGGREHAIVTAVAKSSRADKIYCAPGNAGIAALAECVPIGAMEFDKLVSFAREKEIDFTIIGMDDPLVGGIVDVFEAEGLKVFGPRKNAAILEGSKAFSKDLMKKYNIPTAAYENFTDPDQALEYLKSAKMPIVLKADGLALGKGVLICNTLEEAEAGVKEIMEDKKFGAAGNTMVIEEFLTGREVSVLSFVDGKSIQIMSSAQDHKRAKDGDEGLNTGGMGNFSPSPFYTREVDEFCQKYIYQPTVDAMAAEGRPFTGVIFFGLMLTEDGPKVLEYNARFGDPEAQVVLPRMKNDILDVMEACVEGRLSKLKLEFEDNAAVCVVLASDGYPVAYEKGFPIKGLEKFAGKEDYFCFHAGTKFDDNGTIVTNGGRVLGVTATGADLKEARAKAYQATEWVDFDNKYMRHDIGKAIDEAPMSDSARRFSEYLEQQRQYAYLSSLLYWDMKTKTPPKGQANNIKAQTYISMESFRKQRDPEVEQMLETLLKQEEFEALSPQLQFTVKKMKRDLDKIKRIPEDFYEAFVEEQAKSEAAWEKAKQTNDFALFAPHLEKIIDMTIQMAGYTDPGKEVYDVLLDRYEEGMDSAAYDRLFEDMKRELIPLVKSILEKGQLQNPKFVEHYPKHLQQQACDMILEYMGFSFENGATGETEHPFTLNLGMEDVRITNHFHEDDALAAIFTAIHEGGHAIYEQNVNPAYAATLAGDCSYMGIHESQSRFYENILGRNLNFWKPIYPKLQEILPQFADVTVEEFYQEINHVKNSLIRTEADELTYCFHIILRYELEKMMIRDRVPVSKLPELWRDKMEEYLGIQPETDAEGILQDVHWSGAMIGYFPSYLLGTIYDGMYLEAMEQELGSVNEILAAGEVKKITKWLNEKIHRYGSIRLPKDTILEVCGKEATAEPVIRHFQKKYAEVYRL